MEEARPRGNRTRTCLSLLPRTIAPHLHLRNRAASKLQESVALLLLLGHVFHPAPGLGAGPAGQGERLQIGNVITCAEPILPEKSNVTNRGPFVGNVLVLATLATTAPVFPSETIRRVCWSGCKMSRPSGSQYGTVSIYPSILNLEPDQFVATSPYQSDSPNSAVADDLPPFATLTTDEARERKAERTSPGTYNVVVNPDSFQHMPEYSDDPDLKSLRLSPLRRASLATSLASSLGKEPSLDAGGLSGDPNIVVLPRFEDTARRATAQWRDLKSPTSPLLPSLKIKVEEEEEEEKEEEGSPAESSSIRRTTVTAPQHEGQDSKYMVQFRNVVWKQLVQAEPAGDGASASPSSSADVMEEVAANFPPVSKLFPLRQISLNLRGGTGYDR